jgi:peptidoglycan/LPS O-acetylase OafA/YrhL
LTVIWFMPDALGASVERGAPPALLSYALWIGSVAAITPLAWLSYRFVERPGHSLGTRLCRRIQGLTPERQADDARAACGRSAV